MINYFKDMIKPHANNWVFREYYKGNWEQLIIFRIY